MAGPDPQYNILTALEQFAPGVVLTRDIDAALGAQYAANGYTPLTSVQVLAIVGPLPAFPSGMPRFEDSNPAVDGWALDRRQKFIP